MKYRKKPVVIEAFQMTVKRRISNADWPEWLNEAWNKERDEICSVFPRGYNDKEDKKHGVDKLIINTLEGNYVVSWDDWIICGIKGELYPCKPDIFEATYEKVEN